MINNVFFAFLYGLGPLYLGLLAIFIFLGLMLGIYELIAQGA